MIFGDAPRHYESDKQHKPKLHYLNYYQHRQKFADIDALSARHRSMADGRSCIVFARSRDIRREVSHRAEA